MNEITYQFLTGVRLLDALIQSAKALGGKVIA